MTCDELEPSIIPSATYDKRDTVPSPYIQEKEHLHTFRLHLQT